MVKIKENGDKDPRGRHDGNPDAYGEASYDRVCPFCGTVVGNKMWTHLPCDESDKEADANV